MIQRLTLIVLVSAASILGQGYITQGSYLIESTPPRFGRSGSLSINGPPLAPYALLVDGIPGSSSFPGVGTLWLGVSPFFTVVVDGFALAPPIDPVGTTTLPFALPASPGAAGFVLYAQVFGADGVAPAGFSFSNGLSLLALNPDSYAAAFSPLTNPRAFCQSARLADGQVMTAGGGAGNFLQPTATASVECYDPYARTFSLAAPMSTPRTLHRLTKLPGGRVLASGGSRTLGAPAASIEVFDPLNGAWAPPIPLNSPRIAHTATLLQDGRVLLAGGSTSFVLTPPTSTNYLPLFQSASAAAEIYDPQTGTLTVLLPMNEARFGHAATLLPSGRVLISGGVKGGFSVFGIGSPLYATTAEVFDPTTMTFTTAASPAVSRIVHTQTLLGDGRVLAIGGAAGLLVVTTGTSEFYDEVLDLWMPGPTLPGGATIALHTTTSLASGDLYVAGGAIGALGSFMGVDGAWRFSIGGGFQALANLPAPRQGHSAAAIDDGVMLIGGADAGNPPAVNANALATAVHWSGM